MFAVSSERTMAGAKPKFRDRPEDQRLIELTAEIAEKERRLAELEGKIARARRTVDTLPGAKIPPMRVIQSVAERHGVPVEAITGSSRGRTIMAARFEAIREVADARPDLSSTQIGWIFNRHHTTILSALRPRNEAS